MANWKEDYLYHKEQPRNCKVARFAYCDFAKYSYFGPTRLGHIKTGNQHTKPPVIHTPLAASFLSILCCFQTLPNADPELCPLSILSWNTINPWESTLKGEKVVVEEVPAQVGDRTQVKVARVTATRRIMGLQIVFSNPPVQVPSVSKVQSPLPLPTQVVGALR